MASIFDLETDGLLDKVTKIHCLVIRDTETDEHVRCHASGFPAMADMTIEGGLEYLQRQQALGNTIVGHNVISYDIPVIEKLYPQFKWDKSLVLDTLVMSRLIYSNIKDIDSGLLKKGKIPGKLFGQHSLKAWGYRLGEHKGDYADDFKAAAGDSYVAGNEWLTFSLEMLDYCVQDTQVTALLLSKLLAKEYAAQAILLEHQIAWLMAQQVRNGFCFNEAKAAALYAKLSARRAELERECAALFSPWEVRLPDLIPKRDNKTRGYVAGVPVQKFKTVMFNPNSRDHIANRLQALYGWKPTELTDGGKPKVDEEVMGKLDYPPCKLLTEFLLVQKRISQIAEGEQAWLKLCRKGKIHGSINPNGAVTGRATHSYPNISQVPAGSSPYGHECRELFGVPPGWILVGSDASGLELRCLAHFMAKYDGGKYGNALLREDIHWVNVLSMGLTTSARIKDDPYHEVLRGGAKTFIYGFLYGSGDEKSGRIVYDIILKCKALGLPYKDLVDKYFAGSESPSSDELKRAGSALKSSFMKKLPALKKLIKAVKDAAKANKSLKGLDGRRIHIRSLHSCLNALLQSAGGLTCKQWLVFLEEDLQARGLKHGWDGDYAFCAWSHDECQIACRTPEVAELIASIAKEMVTKSGDHFNFRCRLDGDSKTGLTWAETH
jgi:DNA polymerase-1